MSARNDDALLLGSIRTIRIFCCYAHKNRVLRDQLERHLGALKRSGQVIVWSDREILPGSVWNDEIDINLNTADIILLLISDYFLNSDYCWGVEMRKALERHQTGKAHVIPILLNPVDCEGTPIDDLQMLPTDRKPITKWPDRHEAFLDIVQGIRRAVKVSQSRQWAGEGTAYYKAKQYDKALVAYEQAIYLEPGNPALYVSKGGTLFHLQRYEEAIIIYDEAIHLDSKCGLAHKGKGKALEAFAPLAQEKYKRLASDAYEQAKALGISSDNIEEDLE